MIEQDAKSTVAGSGSWSGLGVLTRFEGTPESFLGELVDVLAELTHARSGAVLRIDRARPDAIDVVAVRPTLPPGSDDPLWLRLAAQSAAEVLASGQTIDRPLGDGRLVLTPLGDRGAMGMVGAFLFEQLEAHVALPASRILELGPSLVDLYEARRSGDAGSQRSSLLRSSLELTAAMGAESTFKGVSMALVNELTVLFNAQRVSAGLLRGRNIHLEAMSHTDKLLRNSELVRHIESALEECFDQDVEILASRGGAPEGSTYIARDTIELAQREAGAEVCTLPLRREGSAIGAICLERPRGQEWKLEEVEALRLACELVTPRLIELRERDRWLGARMAVSARRIAAGLIGAQHTWAKLLAIGLLGLVLFATFVKGADEASAPCVIRASDQRVVAAPFSGFLEKVQSRPGDQVLAGQTLLALLATTEMELKLAEAQSRQLAAQRQAAIAQRDGEEAAAQIARAQRDEAKALVTLLQHQIDSARLVAPIDGVVVEQDLRDRVGGAVRMGEPLYRIIPSGALRAELALSSERVAEVETGMRGHLATVSFPEESIGFVVERISPAGEEIDGRTVFRVDVRLEDLPTWLRPGMEGVAKVHLGERTYGRLWTRRMVNWLRLRLWV